MEIGGGDSAFSTLSPPRVCKIQEKSKNSNLAYFPTSNYFPAEQMVRQPSDQEDCAMGN
jgi:hypothetical protein